MKKLRLLILKVLLRLVFAFVILSLFIVVPFRWLNPSVTMVMADRWLGSDDNFQIKQRWLSWEKMPKQAALAVVASEDQLFPMHAGFDFDAILKCLGP